MRRVAIPKRAGKTRPLGIPTVRDRVVQAAAKLLLEPIFEADFEGCSFGFRPGVGQGEALAEVDRNARQGYRWVAEADIEQFFDQLDHQQLMAALRRRVSDGEVLRLIYRWLKAGYLLDGVVHDTEAGSPQGGVLSPLLANVYLHAFDQAQKNQKAFVGRLVRYADDFLIQCGTRQQAERALSWAREALAFLGLRLHPEKTQVVEDAREGFDFLGFHHRRVLLQRQPRERRGVLRWPSQKACRQFREAIRQRVGRPGTTRKRWGLVCRAVNAYLRGWVHYFRRGSSGRTFLKLDEWVRERVARNLARSQPTGKRRRGRSWVAYAEWLRQHRPLLSLYQLQHAKAPSYRGQARVRWRAG